MKKFLFFPMFLILISCNNLIKDKTKFFDYNCPKVFFSAQDKLFINTLDNSTFLDSIYIKAELNHFAITKKCEQKDEIVTIPLDILIIVEPTESLPNKELNIPMYVALLDQNDNLLETQYFMFSGVVKTHPETGYYIETDITDKLEVITNKFNTSQVVIGFMIDKSKRELLN